MQRVALEANEGLTNVDNLGREQNLDKEHLSTRTIGMCDIEEQDTACTLVSLSRVIYFATLHHLYRHYVELGSVRGGSIGLTQILKLLGRLG